MRATVLAITSDQHCGGTTALCPKRIALDDGGEYCASKAQQWLYECWGHYWKRVEHVRKKEGGSLIEVFLGDLVEGFHHKSSQILSGNPNAQAAVLTACIATPLKLEPDKIFVVRGTETHVGQSASAEERIADGLRRDKRPIVGDPDTGTASWWHLRMEIDGIYLDFAHHGRTGQREHTRAGAASLHAHDIFLSHVKAGDRAPDLCVRAHYHRFNDSHDAAPTRVVTSGAWQLATGYVHKIAADSMADVGGFIIVIKGGEYAVEKVHFKPDRGAIWRPS